MRRGSPASQPGDRTRGRSGAQARSTRPTLRSGSSSSAPARQGYASPRRAPHEATTSRCSSGRASREATCVRSPGSRLAGAGRAPWTISSQRSTDTAGGSRPALRSSPRTHSAWQRTSSSSQPGRPGTNPEQPPAGRRRAAIPGLDGTLVLGLGRALDRAWSDPRSLGQRVVILDETGSYAPLGLAEVLAGAGTHVRLLTPAPAVGADAAAELELPHVMPRLRRLGVELTVWRDIDSVEGRRVIVEDVWSGGRTSVEDVDAIVLARQRAPRDSLFDELRAAGRQTRLVGDARSPARLWRSSTRRKHSHARYSRESTHGRGQSARR